MAPPARVGLSSAAIAVYGLVRAGPCIHAMCISYCSHSNPPNHRTTMPSNLDNDDYVANLLKQEAKNATKKYELVGIDAFNPRRCVASLGQTMACN
jgi:hypothetical protein